MFSSPKFPEPLETTRTLIQWVSDSLLWVKMPGCEFDHSPPYNTELCNVWVEPYLCFI